MMPKTGKIATLLPVTALLGAFGLLAPAVHADAGRAQSALFAIDNGSIARSSVFTIDNRPVRADFDGDTDVDIDDFLVFRSCVSGPAVPLSTACAGADLDDDRDIDHSDFGIFQRCYSGAGNPADPACAD